MSETTITKKCGHRNQKTHQRNYRKSDKGKATDKRYRQSEKGKISSQKGRKKFRRTEKYKLGNKRYRQTEKSKATLKRYCINNPEKVKALHAVNNAIRDGKLVRPDTFICSFCSKQAENYHHPSYKPEHHLDVIPVCIKCHNLIHKPSALPRAIEL